MSGELSRGDAWWKYNTGEDAGYLQVDEKTPEALLQFGIDLVRLMRSIAVRGWSTDFGLCGLDSEIAVFNWAKSNLHRKTVWRQYLMGSLTGAVSS